MLRWSRKCYGAVCAHGHCHGNIDEFNEENADLRVDVGLDGSLADFKPISLEDLYAYFKHKANGKPLAEYALENIEIK